MLGIDVSVWLALVLSLVSVILCVGYGLTRWNADGEGARPPSGEAPGQGREA